MRFWVGRVGYLAKAEREPAWLLFRNLRRMGAFAVVGRSWVVGVMTGSGCAGRHRLGLGVGRVAQTERLAGAVERFVCGSGGRVEVSKCRAVLGPAFAGVGRELGGRGDDGVRLCGVVSVELGRPV